MEPRIKWSGEKKNDLVMQFTSIDFQSLVLSSEWHTGLMSWWRACSDSESPGLSWSGCSCSHTEGLRAAVAPLSLGIKGKAGEQWGHEILRHFARLVQRAPRWGVGDTLKTLSQCDWVQSRTGQQWESSSRSPSVWHLHENLTPWNIHSVAFKLLLVQQAPLRC